MHEYSIAEALLDRVMDEARRHEAVAVTGVNVRLGALSGVEPDLLATAWELVREGTLCAAAPLALERTPAAWACPACHERLAVGTPLRCPRCEEPGQLQGGDEILLERVELEVPDVRTVRV